MTDDISLDRLPTRPTEPSGTDIARLVLGNVSEHLGVVDAWVDAMTGGGAAIWQGIRTARAEGERWGYVMGFAAAICGADATWARNELDVWNREGSSTAETARWSGYTIALHEGFNDAMKLPLEARQQLLASVIDYAAERGLVFTPHGDEFNTLVNGVAHMLESAGQEFAGDAQALQAQADDDDDGPPSPSPAIHHDHSDDAADHVDGPPDPVEDDPGTAAQNASSADDVDDDATVDWADVDDGTRLSVEDDPSTGAGDDEAACIADEDDPGASGDENDEGSTPPGNEDDPGADPDENENEDASSGVENDPASDGDPDAEICYPEDEPATSEEPADITGDDQTAYDTIDGTDSGEAAEAPG